MDSASSLVLAAGVFVSLQILYTLLVRTFPNILGSAILKGLDHRNAQQLERLRGELSQSSAKELEHLRAEYETLRASTEYLSANQSELRSRMISAAELLWNDMLALRQEFDSLINFETIFLPAEIADAIERGKGPQIMQWAEDYRDEAGITAKLVRASGSGTEKCRLFVGDKAWLSYYVFRTAILRIAYMLNVSLKKRDCQNWRADKPTLNLLKTALGQTVLDQTLNSELPGLNFVIGNLEAKFLTEAMRIMSGSKVYADSISDIRSTMAYETARTKSEAERHGVTRAH